MKADESVLRAYAALVTLYPRRFRDEYGAELVQLAQDLCRDHPTWRVASRLLVDLAISIPAQHLEVHVRRNTSNLVPLLYAVVAAAGLVLALVGGTSIPSLIVGLAVATVAGWLAVIAWRKAVPIGGSALTAHWWKFTVAGPVIVGSVIVAAGFGVEAWFAGLFAVFLAMTLTGVGLLLGFARLVTRRPPALPT